MRYSPRRLVFSLGLIAALSIGCSNPSADEKASLASSKSSVSKSDKKDLPAAPPAIKTPKIVGNDEQENCTPVAEGSGLFGKSDCKEGLVCAPSSSDTSKGSCRVSCGVVSSGKITKQADKCESDRSCQIAVSLAFDELGAYCLPKQTKRDGACSAMSDDQACSDGRFCGVTDVNKDASGQPLATSFVCRDACEYGKADASASCQSGEKCVAYPYDSTSQKTSDGKPVVCTETKCTGDMAGCECDHTSGYQCSAMIPGVIAFCERKAGMCVTPVAFSQSSDFGDGGFSGESCNEIKGHAFCDNSVFEGLDKGGQALCMQYSAETGDGFCFGFCSVPALDMDGDGKLSEEEAGKKLSCPKNYTCSTNLGRSLAMIAAISDPKAPGKKKSCDPAKCEANKPCPSQCGIGDAECLSYPSKSGATVSFCGAPYGNCELQNTTK